MPFETPATLTGRPPGAGVLLGRRPKLPNGRAVFGGFLVAAAAAIVFVAALGGHAKHPGEFAVAERPLAAGTVIAPGDTALAPVQLPSGSAGTAYSAPSALTGRSLLSPVLPGELIESSMLAPAGGVPALRPVSVDADPVSVAGLVPGDTVDVLAVAADGSATSSGGSPEGASGSVAVVVRGASLISVDRSGGASLGSTASTLVTLGVGDLSEVEAVVGASHTGLIALVKAEPGDGVGPGGPA
jgi:Flp pilus assembly protein CpaB